MSDGSESTAPVRYERVGSAALITIDRQHRRNAVDGPTAQARQEVTARSGGTTPDWWIDIR